jgi:ADP-heptose:LPS heptosyltransferase
MREGKRGMLAAMLLAVEGVFRTGTRALEPARASQVLFLEYRLPLGCLVHMTPVFEAIRQCRPEIEISVATRGLGLQVLRHSRSVDRLIETPDPTADLGGAVRGLRRELRRRGARPDCVLTGASDRRTRIALVGMLGCDGWRGGYTLKPALYHRPLGYDDGLSLIRNNLRLAQLIGCDADVPEPRVFFSEPDAAAARALLEEANPEHRPLLAVVTQNSGGQSTGWHTDRFVRVIDHAVHRLGCAVVYLGTAADAAPIDAIRAAAAGLGHSIAGRTSVSELAAVLALSDVAVTLDTGTMHVGRASGVPMVVLGPSWQKPLEWMPLGVENVRILRGQDRVGVPPGYRLDEISADTVIAALGELAGLYPASAAAREDRLRAGLSEVDHLA